MDDAAGSGEIAIDRDALADDVLDRLEPGTIVDNKVILSRRQLLGVASGGLSAGALATLSATEARAADDSIGQIGEAGGSIDLVVDELKDPGGDVIVDVDDTGSLDWQRASSFPSVDTDDLSGTGIVERDGVVIVDDADHSDLGAALNQAVTDNGSSTTYVIRPGTYTQTTQADFTGLAGGRLHFPAGADVTVANAGGIAYDFTGANLFRVTGRGRVTGDGTDTPDVCFLFAREDGGAGADRHHITDVQTRGSWNVSVLYNYGSETCSVARVSFWSDSGRAATITQDNVDGVSSPHTTIATGSQSMNDIHIYGASQFRATQGDATGEVFLARSVDTFVLDGGIIMGNNEAGLRIDTGAQDFESPDIRGVRFHDAGGGSLEDGIIVEGGNNVSGGGVENCGFNVAQKPIELASDTDLYDFRWKGHWTGAADQAEDFGGTLDHRCEVTQSVHFGLSSPTMQLNNVDRGSVVKGWDMSVSGSVDRGAEVIRSRGRMNLANTTPLYDGEELKDDGTNFEAGERAYADTGSGVWRAYSDPANNTVAY